MYYGNDLATEANKAAFDKVYQSMENRAKSYLQSSTGPRLTPSSMVSRATIEEQSSKQERLVRLKQFLKKDTQVVTKLQLIQQQEVQRKIGQTGTNFFQAKSAGSQNGQRAQSKTSPMSLLSLDKSEVPQGYGVSLAANRKILSALSLAPSNKTAIVASPSQVMPEILDEVLDVGQDSIHQSLLDSSQQKKKNIMRSTFQDLNRHKSVQNGTGTGWRIKTGDPILGKEANHPRSSNINVSRPDSFLLQWTSLLDTSWELAPLDCKTEVPMKTLEDSSYPAPFVPVRLQDYVGTDVSAIHSEHDWYLRGKFVILLKTSK